MRWRLYNTNITYPRAHTIHKCTLVAAAEARPPPNPWSTSLLQCGHRGDTPRTGAAAPDRSRVDPSSLLAAVPAAPKGGASAGDAEAAPAGADGETTGGGPRERGAPPMLLGDIRAGGCGESPTRNMRQD